MLNEEAPGGLLHLTPDLINIHKARRIIARISGSRQFYGSHLPAVCHNTNASAQAKPQ